MGTAFMPTMLRLQLLAVLLALGLLLPGGRIGAATPATGSQSAELPGGLDEEGVYLVIDKSSNRLTVFLNGRPMYVFPVATGRQRHLTPEGTFRIVTKIRKPWYVRKQIPGGHPNNPLGSRWMGINVPGSGGYRYGIHGTNRPYSIGTDASSGCIRMFNKHVEWLYEHIPLGTIVIVQE